MKYLRLFAFCGIFATLAFGAKTTDSSKKDKKKGPVVDLGTLNIEGETRQPNLQYIEGPAVKDRILKKVFTNSIRDIETRLLAPATSKDFPELKGNFKK
jgi:hypothetical protein